MLHIPLTVLGGGPTRPVTAMQTGFTTVLVLRNERITSHPPSGGYLITVIPGTTSVTVPALPHKPGIYNIQVTSISQHLPSGTTELEGFTLRGEL